MRLRLSIIILTYRSAGTIGECLASVRRACKKIPHEVIVVDNASSDDTVLWLQKKEKGVKLIRNKINAGFARGVNIGLKRAKGEYVLFLNPDVIVGERSIKTMIDDLDKHEGIGVVGPRFIYPDGRLQASFGNMATVGTELMQLFWIYRLLPWGRVVMPNVFSSAQFDSSHDVDWVSGGCLMMRAELAHKLHGFDERFFMYMEDIDLCARVRDSGYSILYESRSEIKHVHRASFHGRFTLGNLFEARSVMYFLNKWYGYRFFSHFIIWSLLKIKFFIKLVLAQAWFERGSGRQFDDYWQAWKEI